MSELCNTHWLFTDTIEMHEKCCKLNPTCRKMSVTSLIKHIFFGVNYKNKPITLLTLDYKVLVSVYAKRLSYGLDHII